MFDMMHALVACELTKLVHILYSESAFPCSSIADLHDCTSGFFAMLRGPYIGGGRDESAPTGRRFARPLQGIPLLLYHQGCDFPLQLHAVQQVIADVSSYARQFLLYFLIAQIRHDQLIEIGAYAEEG
jgi:hypothetical protein